MRTVTGYFMIGTGGGNHGAIPLVAAKDAENNAKPLAKQYTTLIKTIAAANYNSYPPCGLYITTIFKLMT